MSTTTPLTDRINALTTYANEVTGQNDTTLSDAVAHLTAGYGNNGYTVDGIINRTEPYGEITTTATTLIDNTFARNTGITIFHGPNITTIVGNNVFSGSKVQEIYLPVATSIASNFCNWNTSFRLLDLGAATSINNNGCFYNDSAFNTLIIRTNSVCSLGTGGNSWTGTPFKTGTGTVYVPQALIDSYQTADNWSTFYSAGTQFVAIEGSQYEL